MDWAKSQAILCTSLARRATQLWKALTGPRLSLVRLKKRPWIRRWVLINLQHCNSSFSKTLGGEMCNHLLGWGRRHSTLWNPYLGHCEGDRRRTQELRILPVGRKIFRMKRLEKASTPATAHFVIPFWKASECAFAAWWASPRPLSTGKGEGWPVHLTPPSLQGREGCSLSKGLCQSFVGGGWGNYKSQRKPILKPRPTAVDAEEAVWRGLWEMSLTPNFLVMLVASGGTEEKCKLLYGFRRKGRRTMQKKYYEYVES